MGFTVEWYHYVVVATATVICSVFICVGCKLFGERNMKKMIVKEWAKQGMLAKMNEKPPEVVVPVSLRVEDDPRLAVRDHPLGNLDEGEEPKLGFIPNDVTNERKDTAEWRLYSSRLAERYGLEPGNYRELVLTKPPDTSFGLYFEEHRPVIGLIEPDSPAAQQGLETGMRILAINNERVYSPADAVEALQQPSTQYVCVVDIDPVDSPNLRQTREPIPPLPPKKEHFVDNEVEKLLQTTWEDSPQEEEEEQEDAGLVFLGSPFVAAPSDPPPPPMFDQFKHTIRTGEEEDNNSLFDMSHEERASLPRRVAPPATLIRDHTILGLRRPQPLSKYVPPPGIKRNNPSVGNFASGISPPTRRSMSRSRTGIV